MKSKVTKRIAIMYTCSECGKSKGAEAVLIQSNTHLLKRRVKKSYRHPQLDEKIRKQRTKKEVKLLEKARSIIPVPKVIQSSEKEKEIDMDFISGKKLSEHLEKLPYQEICEQMGINLALLHNAEIIHGDLTTSNMIISKETLYFIDFGLGFQSNKVEDKAVDLHLIKQALEAKHYEISKECFKFILAGYKQEAKNFNQILARLKKVESRGRYKQKN